jgi:transposase
MTRDLIDTAAWALIAPFLPPERGRACRPSLDNRRVLDSQWTLDNGAYDPHSIIIYCRVLSMY